MTSIIKQSRVEIVPAESAVSDESEVREEITSEEVPPGYEKISRLAYSFWQERGCPMGSPEEDWFLAEQAVQLYSLHKQVGRETGVPAVERALSKSA